MKSTIKSMVNHCYNIGDLTQAFADLYHDAERYGTFCDTETHCVTLYETWTIVSNRINKIITFIDSTNDTVNFKQTGDKYTTIRLIIK